MKKPEILIVDDELSMRQMVSIFLQRKGYTTVEVESGRKALDIFKEHNCVDLIVSDMLMVDGGGIDLLREIKKIDPDCEVVLITAYGTTESAVEAMKSGAFDYLTKPFNMDEFAIIVEKALERRSLIRENKDLKSKISGKYQLADIVGNSLAMQRVINLSRKIKDLPSTVLISGESGSGKEVLAKAIHFNSKRKNEPFLAINCGALPENLMESELFGHKKGSFTGAHRDRIGLLENAENGIIFLDEIGELPMNLQVKLLRVLQERVVRPVGGNSERKINARIMAASNQNLARQVEEGSFRQDLYYRLNVIQIHMPPLRERTEDISELARQILADICQNGESACTLSSEATGALMKYDFPGNVRELANMLERAQALALSKEIQLDDLSEEVISKSKSTSVFPVAVGEGIDLDETLMRFERRLITKALEKSDGVITRAATLLNVTFRSLRYRLKKLKMDEIDGE